MTKRRRRKNASPVKKKGKNLNLRVKIRTRSHLRLQIVICSSVIDLVPTHMYYVFLVSIMFVKAFIFISYPLSYMTISLISV